MARPRAANYDDKRQLIRECAAELFARRGFAGTAMTDIADASGCTKSLLYHYFRSKQAILYDLLAAHMHELLDAVGLALASPQPDAKTRFRAFVRAHLRIYATARAKHILLLNELDALPPRQRDAIREQERRLVGLAADLLAELAPPLKNHPRLRVPAAMSFYGLINWTYTWYRPDGSLGPQEYADLASDIILEGLPRAISRNLG